MPTITVPEVARRARAAARQLALVPTTQKNDALLRAADALDAAGSRVLEANARDLTSARDADIRGALLERLTLTTSRVAAMAQGLRDIAQLPDPVGATLESFERPNGLAIRKVRVPLGVVAVIYEARPNVTSDVAGLCLKSGNAAILRGSASALHSNRAVVAALAPALDAAGMPGDSVQLLDDVTRAGAAELMRMRGDVDLLVPRGGRALIEQIIETATVPYVIDGDGNCHVYVDAAADLDMAVRIVLNAKASRPSVCNSAEKLLVHGGVAGAFVPRIVKALQDAGVEVRGDERCALLAPGVISAREEDWDREYLDMIIAVRVVDNLDAAIEHVRLHSSGHTEAIVTGNRETARRFVAECPAAVVMVNASTRFTDGGEFGYGAEIGNSTQRLHARGPMGLRELTTYRLEVWGTGQVRE